MPTQSRSNARPSKPLTSFLISEDLAEHSKAQAFIVPSTRRYNDFGYRIACSVGFRNNEGTITWLEGRCAIQGEKFLDVGVRDALTPGTSELYHPDMKRPFRTLLVDAKSYGVMRRALGEASAREILGRLQDIAIAKKQPHDHEWASFFQEDVFAQAMVRSSEAYFAYRKGERVLQGLHELDADAQTRFGVDLKGIGPKTYFDFQFDGHNFLRGRIAVIVGRNGCGKTSTLAKLSKVLCDKESRLAEIDQRPELNQVIVFAPTNSIRQFSPSSKEGLARARVFSFNPASPRKYREDTAATLLVDVARGQDAYGSLLNHLSDIFKSEFGDFSVLVPIKLESMSQYNWGNVEYMLFDDWARGEEQRVLKNAGSIAPWKALKFLDKTGRERKLSLGQQAFLRFILVALANSGAASAFLIDEPENFLHPNLISRFMRSLNKILIGTRSIAIVATHSPFVVREVQSAQVHVMRDEDGILTVRKPLMQTLGANVSSISNEVFGDDLPHHLHEELLEIAEQRSHTFAEALANYSSELSTEALMRLRRMMEEKG